MNQLDKINSDIEQIETRRQELFEIREPIDNELMSSAKKLRKLQDKRDKILVTTNSDDWTWLLSNGENKSKSHAAALDQKLQEHGFRPGGGYLPQTGQSVVQIALILDDEDAFQKTLEGLQSVLPHVTPITDSSQMRADQKRFAERHGSCKFIKIFEHTLSLNASYGLLIGEDEYTVFANSWVKHSENNLESILRYIQKHHYYSRKGDQP